MAVKTKDPPKRVKPPANPSENLASRSDPNEPGDAGPQIIHIPSQPAGVRVNEDTAMTLGAVYACVRLISEDIAGLPYRVYERRANGGRDEKADDPADPIINFQANPETPAFFWRETTIAHALTWGNGYSEIETNNSGQPVALWQLTPDRVEVNRFKGRIIYDVRNGSGPNTVLESRDVFHLRGLGYDGLIGYSVIQLAARAIGLGMSLEQSASTFSSNDSTPGGLLKHPTRLSEQARNNLLKTWQARHSGPSNRRTVAILEEGLDWQQTGLPPDDAQLVQQRQFTPAEICRWFRVKPHKIADLTHATFSNIEQQSIEHVTDTLLPWGRRLESEANIKLFPLLNRGRRFTKLNFMGLLRGDSAARQSYFTTMLDRGVFSINDVRGLEDMNPIGPDGDKRFVALNMQLLEKAGEEPEPPEEPIEPDEPVIADESDNGDMRAKIGQSLAPIFEDACDRVNRRAEHRIADAVKRLFGKPDEFSRWQAHFEAEHHQYATEAIMPAALTAAKLLNVPSERTHAAVAKFVETHLQRLRTVQPGPDSAVNVANKYLEEAHGLLNAIVIECKE